jgi:photosystem II stability/assembly factor-like uncharacterized protein
VRASDILLFAVALLWGAAAPAADVEGDDPTERLQAMREWYGADASRRAPVLEAARRERDRYAVGESRAQAFGMNALAASGSAFLNLGPTRADFAVNGDKYFEIDSGRARQIVAHPIDPDVLYLATSGGGVWKTYDARASTVHWEPLTDALGTTSVGTLAMDPSNPEILFLGFGDPFDVQQPGLVRSADGGGTWSAPVQLRATYSSPSSTVALTAGSVTDIKVDPRNSLVVLATTDVGLFRSTDGGATWSQVNLSANGVDFYYMWSIAYVGNDSWIVTGQAADLAMPPTPAGRGAIGLWRSTDDGLTWTSLAQAIPGGDNVARFCGRATLAAAESTLNDPATARVYLLVGRNDGLAQLDLFRSDDGGLTFASLSVNSSRAPLNPNADQRGLDVLSEQAWYNQALFVDPGNPDAVFIGGQLAMIRSMDGGRNWYVLSDWLPKNSENNDIDRPYVHADMHTLAVGADGTFYAGTDGGIFASVNALSAPALDVTFTSAHNEGLVTHLLYTVICAPESWPAEAQGYVAGGMQDNGTRVRFGQTTTFNQVLGGDGIGLAVSAKTRFDPSLQVEVPEILLASVAGGLFRSTDGGQNFSRFTGGLGRLPFLVRIVRTAAPDVFLTLGGAPAGIFKWQVGTPFWTMPLTTLQWQDLGLTTNGFATVEGTPISLRNLAAHPNAPQIWAAVSNRFTYMTTDGGAHWLVGVQPRPHKPDGTLQAGGAYLFSSVEFDPRDPSGQSYYITSLAANLIDPQNHFTPYPANFGHVFRTDNGGLSWQSMGGQDVAQGGLPNVGAAVIKVDPADSNTLYVGTEIGLYRSTDAGQTWSRFGAGTLPLVEVTDICISPASQRLTVATYGRGFWQIDTNAAAKDVGVRGLGDTNFDSRIDGEDLIDLADAFGAAQSSPAYRWQADLVGTTNGIDQSDLDALLARFGGRP